jgi:uncharacterized protein
MSGLNLLGDIPELRDFERPSSVVRIADQIDIPLTERVRKIVDTEPFQRLSKVRQLGFVSLVYPGAVHHRFEHSLGAYRICLLYLRQLLREPDFAQQVDRRLIETLIVAALLHDLGHYPFCHPIEDLGDSRIEEHESLAAGYLTSGPIADLLAEDWSCSGNDVVRLVASSGTSPGERLVRSLLSGPIDVDKMDYLYRDSLHAGVPYGRNFDSGRLIGALCLNRTHSGLAITTKGKTAAELMVFARYVMFSEVYWHHAVRSATAMFQRLFHECLERLDLPRIYASDEASFPGLLQRGALEEPFLAELFLDLLGPKRCLYKRWDQLSSVRHGELFARIARRPFPWLVRLSTYLSQRLGGKLGLSIPETSVLVDAPPVNLEVQFDVDVFDARSDEYLKLRELSPVTGVLADRQFDNIVKQIRVFVHPSLKNMLAPINLIELLEQSLGDVDREISDVEAGQ